MCVKILINVNTVVFILIVVKCLAHNFSNLAIGCKCLGPMIEKIFQIYGFAFQNRYEHVSKTVKLKIK